ncbi:hypothetical protein ATX68_12795 [Oenococcus oeni]|uniref:4-fold beta flower domain-containing protein n=4 Tax=root TaxID=1 RepID=V5UQW0_9CAUD|nr:hypothetical protein CF85_gp39 [Oenococcus phage phiS13]KGH62524.1 hypothetical protein X375_05315 [Oenococcus oeni S13]OIK55977.1 hypothetical protein ATW61_09520 [Oenococcus oeni]AHB80376.1 hypothetical protein [Oenococcus phage phiS13]OIM37104.1 hypothetical protein ATX68_12795 [Oenococcus oeni]OLQ42034.1 hypothetical protein ATX63_09370 [Oenococcus oeni]
MKFLYDSNGKQIAYEDDGDLFSEDGKYLGYYYDDYEIFVSKNGRYLGEIYDDDRLVARINSGFSSTKFSVRSGSVGTRYSGYSTSGISLPSQYENVKDI